MKDLLKSSVWKLGAVVFAVSFAARAVLDFMFQSRLGWHAVNHAESWLYTGVMKGTHVTGYMLQDPTVWLLRGVGVFFPGNLALYGVFLTSAALSALTASLILLLASELYDKKTGFIAGMAYGGMVEPLALSLSGFTHDHLQLPVMVLLLWMTVKAVKVKGWMRYSLVVAYAIIVYWARFINEVVYVAVGASAVYVGYVVLERYYGGRNVHAAYMTLGLVALAAAGQWGLNTYLASKLELLPQGRMGSVDVLPLSMLTFWLRYNMLLFLMPFGVAAAYKRRDTVGLTLTAVGFVVATVMDRGTRISDLGVALLFSYAVVDWGVKEKVLGLDRRNRLYLTAGSGVLASAYVYFNTHQPLHYNIIYLLGGAVLLFTLWRVNGVKGMVAAASVVVLVGVAANAAYVYNLEPRRIVSDTEYHVLEWLRGNNDGGMVLTGWDRGYMVEVVSGLEAASTPGRIRAEVHDMLWQLDRQAAANLRKAGVRYVMLTSEHFNVVKMGDEMAYRISGGLVFAPENQPPMEFTNRLTVYKLRHDTAPRYFRLLKNETDPSTGVKVMLYEVASEPAEGSLVGGIAVNHGSEKNASLEAAAYGSREYSEVYVETFKSNEVKEVVYPVGKWMREFNCSLAPVDEWGYTGTITYLNMGGAHTVDANVVLVDAGSGETVDSALLRISFRAGEKRTVQYTFKPEDLSREYLVGHNVIEGVDVLENESTPPVLEGVGVLAMFC